jgi:hypothetical protein
LDPPSAPRGILSGHPADQILELDLDRRAAGLTRPRLPAPVEPKALAVPGEDCRGPNNEQAGPPARPQTRQAHPEDPIPWRKPRPPDRALKDGQLVTQRRVLKGDRRRPAEQGTDKGPETDEEDHLGSQQ